jgi:uracil-DNA glycosylase
MTLQETFGNWLKLIDTSLLFNTLNKLPQSNLCPSKENVFRAFTLCPLESCKIIFIGQDPYPQKGVATGVLFGNHSSENISPSLQIIRDAAIDWSIQHNYPIVFDNTLESWAKQGILMINSSLTTEMNKIGSHTNLWRPFISDFIEKLSKYQSSLYVLFGEQAQSLGPYIAKNNTIIKEKHPAFYARTNTPMPPSIFYEVNRYMKEQYGYTIEWYKEGQNE